MSTIAEIEAAIEKLPPDAVDELARWIENRRARRTGSLPVDSWLERARGAARPDVSTEGVLAVTRGEE